MHDSTIRYTIDAGDNIKSVSESWYRFALGNQGDQLSDENVLGRSLWDFISDTPTRDIYKQMLARVRQGRLTEFTFRCDGPSWRRLLLMRVIPKDLNAIEFETSVLKLEERESSRLLSLDAPRSTDLLRLCEREQMPQLSHGMCDPCVEKFASTLAIRSD